MDRIKNNSVVVWCLAVLFAAMSMMAIYSASPSVPTVQAHESGYVGTDCYRGYPGTSVGWAETDCLGYTYFGKWYQNGNGYWYHYLYGGYYHYWWGVYYKTTERTMGYCWDGSYCVQY